MLHFPLLCLISGHYQENTKVMLFILSVRGGVKLLEYLQDIINYLNENISDPVPRYILNKEIIHNSSSVSEINK